MCAAGASAGANDAHWLLSDGDDASKNEMAAEGNDPAQVHGYAERVHNGLNLSHHCHPQLCLYHRCYCRAANSCVHGLTGNASEIGVASEVTEASGVVCHELAPAGRDLSMGPGMEVSADWNRKVRVHTADGTVITSAMAVAHDISMIELVAGDESETDGVVRASEDSETTPSEILLLDAG